MQTLRQPILTDTRRPYVAEVREIGSFLPHSHDETELMLVLSGRLQVGIDGLTRTLSAGEGYMTAPNLIHSVSVFPEEETPRALLLEFGRTFFGEDYDLICGKRFSFPFGRPGEPDAPPREPLLTIVRELEPGASLPGAETAVREALCRLFVWMVRECPSELLGTEPDFQDQRMRWSGLFDYLSTHFGEPIRLETAAAQMGYSVYHFSRCFREYTGIPFHRYLNRFRVEQARLLLQEPTLSVTQVAERSGFESIKTFNRVFRQELGCAPSDYRRSVYPD